MGTAPLIGAGGGTVTEVARALAGAAVAMADAFLGFSDVGISSSFSYVSMLWAMNSN